MKSHFGKIGNWNLKGKAFKNLHCGCCTAYNFTKLHKSFKRKVERDFKKFIAGG